MLRNSWPASGLLHIKVFNHVLYYLTGVTINNNVVSAGWVHIHAINKANMPSFLFTFIVPFTCFFLFCSSNVSMDHCFCKLKGIKYVSTSLFRFIQYTLYLTKGYDKIFIFLSPHRDPVYTSPDKTLHRSAFRLHRTHRTVQVFLKANSTAFCGAVIKGRGPGISPTYYECGLWLLS